jgi:hypothetical protein
MAVVTSCTPAFRFDGCFGITVVAKSRDIRGFYNSDGSQWPSSPSDCCKKSILSQLMPTDIKTLSIRASAIFKAAYPENVQPIFLIFQVLWKKSKHPQKQHCPE